MFPILWRKRQRSPSCATGTFQPMRELDDTALTRARLFVDSRATTIAHIGELKDPIARGVISESDVMADF